ncbi:MAG: hypothetical protein ACOCRK_11045 [bacterium]
MIAKIIIKRKCHLKKVLINSLFFINNNKMFKKEELVGEKNGIQT